MALTGKDILILFKQARPLNLIFAVLIYFVATFLLQYPEFSFLFHWKWYLEGVIIVLIMASGYWVNDIFDIGTDYVNKPQKNLINRYISVKKVFTIYLLCVLISLGLSFLIGIKLLFFVHLFVILMLFLYSSYFQKVLFLGNILISGLGGLLVLVPSFLGYGWDWIQFWLAGMGFWTTFLREVIKDIIDMRGDVREGYYTLPIRIGIRATKRFLYIGYLVFFFLWVLPFFMISDMGKMVYGIGSGLTVVFPMVWSLWKFTLHYRPVHFRIHSSLLKWITLGGLLSGILLKIYQ